MDLFTFLLFKKDKFEFFYEFQGQINTKIDKINVSDFITNKKKRTL